MIGAVYCITKNIVPLEEQIINSQVTNHLRQSMFTRCFATKYLKHCPETRIPKLVAKLR